MTEIRWYKGKYKVKVLLKSKGNWGVQALENIPELFDLVPYTEETYACMFTTVPRLLWRHPRVAH